VVAVSLKKKRLEDLPQVRAVEERNLAALVG